ncbi:MAG: hypothetical protein AB1567_03265 [bacterium]
MKGQKQWEIYNAEALIKAGRFKDALEMVIKIMSDDPLNERALDLSIRLRKAIRIA